VGVGVLPHRFHIEHRIKVGQRSNSHQRVHDYRARGHEHCFQVSLGKVGSHSRPSSSCILGGQGPSPFGVPPGGGRGGATFQILMGVAPGSRVLRNSLGEVGEVQPPSSRETVEVAVVVAAVVRLGYVQRDRLLRLLPFLAQFHGH